MLDLGILTRLSFQHKNDITIVCGIAGITRQLEKVDFQVGESRLFDCSDNNSKTVG